MSSRDAIMQRIRGALEQGRKDGYVPREPRGEAPSVDEPVIRQIEPGHFDALLEILQQQMVTLGDNIEVVASIEAAAGWIFQHARGKGMKRGLIDSDARELLGDLLPMDMVFANNADRTEVYRAEFGISLAEFAVAETGSLVLCSGENRLRLASLAPDVHYCLVRGETLLPDVLDGIRAQQRFAHQAGTVWITGSSRTADIDGILIHGAHGPKELYVVMVRPG